MLITRTAISTILLCWVPESEKDHNLLNQINFYRMMVNFNILSDATDQDGNSFKIIKVPVPEIQYLEAKITNQEYDFLKPIYPKLNIEDTLKWVAATSYCNQWNSINSQLLASGPG